MESIETETDRQMRRRKVRFGLMLRGHPQIVETLAGIYSPFQVEPVGVLMAYLEGGDLWDRKRQPRSKEIVLFRHLRFPGQ